MNASCKPMADNQKNAIKNVTSLNINNAIPSLILSWINVTVNPTTPSRDISRNQP